MKKLSAQFVLKLLLITAAAFLVYNFSLLSGAFSKILNVLQPIFIGFVLALILNVPMDFFEKKVFKRIKKDKLRRSLSLVLAIVVFSGILALVLGLALPAAIRSVKSVLEMVTEETNWTKLGETSPILKFLVTQGKVLYDHFISKLQDYVPKMLEIAQNVMSVLINILLGLSIAIMLLANKKGLSVQMKKLFDRVFKNKQHRLNDIAEVSGMALNKFSRYLGGQVIEAVILGFVCYLLMLLLRLPYAPLISMIIGFVNLIPIVGAYAGGTLGAILIFAVSPTKALVFIVFILILQQVEAFTTYPIVVGRYVGLNSFWILVSIVIWGGLLGFWGVFLGVPLTAFLHDFVNMLIMRDKTQLPTPHVPNRPSD